MKILFLAFTIISLSAQIFADKLGDENMTVPKFREMKQGKIGNHLPIRDMKVEDGTLKYSDGSEVALWGTNYLPMSWHQYVNMKQLGTDMKKAMEEDVAHMKEMGMNVVRVHIFDREICDKDGNLIENEHLNLLEYLIFLCSKENIYLMITPISWWSSPVSVENTLSSNYTKMAMLIDETAIKAQENYLSQILNHKNPYTNNTMKEEKNICIYEIFNEPWYWRFADLENSVSDYRKDQIDANILERDKNIMIDIWNKYLDEKGFSASSENFSKFRYDYLKTYINRIVKIMRDEGVSQPIGWSPFELTLNSDSKEKNDPRDICLAIAESNADFFTGSDYLGGFDYRDDKNNMKWLEDFKITGVLNDKACVIYEFDATGTYTSAYLYPGMAKKFRNFGAQIACQFQYDSVADAAYNVDWVTHYLNYLYTPEKTVSFMIAGEAFKSIPRGYNFDFSSDVDLLFGDFYISYDKNISVMSTDNRLYYSSSIDINSAPLKMPVNLEEIVGVGDSPFVKYNGTGIYSLRKKGKEYELMINPDAVKIYNCMNPMGASLDKKTVELEYNAHEMTLNIKDLEKFSVWKVGNDEKREIVKVSDKTFEVEPGNYIIIKK